MADANGNLKVLLLIFNLVLAPLLGIPYQEQKRNKAFDPDQPIFGVGEAVQIVTSCVIAALVPLFL